MTSPVVVNGTPLHEGPCEASYRNGGATYHASYLRDLHLAALYGLALEGVEMVLNPPPPVPTALCADCGVRTTECSPCTACSLNLCVGCQDRHRHLLHVPPPGS